jgi:hypothetical protein
VRSPTDVIARAADQRDAKLTATFNTFQRRPALISAHVARFR